MRVLESNRNKDDIIPYDGPDNIHIFLNGKLDIVQIKNNNNKVTEVIKSLHPFDWNK